MNGDREKCLEAGMDAYLSKPIRSKDLNRVIEDLAQPRSCNELTVVTRSNRLIAPPDPVGA
jgi:CheY-like chemotaxis protein